MGVLDERQATLRWPTGPCEAYWVVLRGVLPARSPPVVHGDDMATVTRTMAADTDTDTDAVPVMDGRLLSLITAQHCVEGRGDRSSDGSSLPASRKVVLHLRRLSPHGVPATRW